MNRLDAKDLTLFLLQEHECDGWYFEWSKATKTFAKVTAKISSVDGTLYNKRLRLSSYLVDLNHAGIVQEVVLHEIAHIKAGLIKQHSFRWRCWCRKLGISTARLYQHPDMKR